MTHLPVSRTKGKHRWRATLLGFPYIVEEAISRDQAIAQIKARIAEILTHAEVITFRAPALPKAADELAVQGWDDHSLFKDDKAALQMFDDIERERNKQFVGEP